MIQPSGECNCVVIVLGKTSVPLPIVVHVIKDSRLNHGKFFSRFNHNFTFAFWMKVALIFEYELVGVLKVNEEVHLLGLFGLLLE